MREMSDKKPADESKPHTPMSSYISEALAKQAALRPPKSPPKLLPPIPTLPRIPKPPGRRRRKV